MHLASEMLRTICFMSLGRVRGISWSRCLSARSKIPGNPTWPEMEPDISKVPKITQEEIEQLERISLVAFSNEESLARLTAAIASANILQQVDTEGVEPLDSVLEDRTLYLREDAVTEGGTLKEILQNASKTEEEYFVAPPGNIPLKPTSKKFQIGED